MSKVQRGYSATVGGGKYVAQRAGKFVTLSPGIIRDGEIESGVRMVFDRPTGIGNSVGAEVELEIRPGAVVYPDKGINSLMVVECVVEYRDNVGITKTFGVERKWDGGYLLTYASVGIPEKIYEWIKGSISKQVMSNEEVRLDEAVGTQRPSFTFHEGYYWTNVKCAPMARDRKPGYFYFMRGDRAEEVVDHVRFMKKSGKSLRALGCFTFRLSRRKGRGPRSWTLGFTMTGVQLIGFSEAHGPGIGDPVSNSVDTSVTADAELCEAMDRISFGDEDEEDEDSEKEEGNDLGDELDG